MRILIPGSRTVPVFDERVAVPERALVFGFAVSRVADSGRVSAADSGEFQGPASRIRLPDEAD
jgi:hypothetical protein